MAILHLNSYYIDNHLYSQLYSILDSDIDQIVYIPIKQDREPENIIDFERTRLVFEKIIEPKHKYNYFAKVKKITNSIISKGIMDGIDFMHAHNLFNDGAVAYRLKKKFDINYIVAVRSTDINLQYRYMFHRRRSIHRVLKNAAKIVFISQSNMEQLFEMMPKKVVSQISHKVQIIPNGIDDIWLTNRKTPRSKPLGTDVRLLFVGKISKRKNIELVVKAVAVLRQNNNLNVTLTIIGPEHINEPDFFKAFLDLIKPLSWVDYKGKINAGEELIAAYRNCDIFVMPSKNELFGLVYIEALSQGMPVVYARGEGIDGFLKEHPSGQAVDPDNPESIAEGIMNIIRSYETYKDFDAVVLPFNWNYIASTYRELYAQHE